MTALTREEIEILREELVRDLGWLEGGKDRLRTLCDMAISSLRGPSEREKIIEECARAAQAYNWADNDEIQGPDEHQKALAQAIKASRCHTEPSNSKGEVKWITAK